MTAGSALMERRYSRTALTNDSPTDTRDSRRARLGVLRRVSQGPSRIFKARVLSDVGKRLADECQTDRLVPARQTVESDARVKRGPAAVRSSWLSETRRVLHNLVRGPDANATFRRGSLAPASGLVSQPPSFFSSRSRSCP